MRTSFEIYVARPVGAGAAAIGPRAPRYGGRTRRATARLPFLAARAPLSPTQGTRGEPRDVPRLGQRLHAAGHGFGQPDRLAVRGGDPHRGPGPRPHAARGRNLPDAEYRPLLGRARDWGRRDRPAPADGGDRRRDGGRGPVRL